MLNVMSKRVRSSYRTIHKGRSLRPRAARGSLEAVRWEREMDSVAPVEASAPPSSIRERVSLPEAEPVAPEVAQAARPDREPDSVAEEVVTVPVDTELPEAPTIEVALEVAAND